MTCEDCKDTGYIRTEGIKLGRSYYSAEHKQIITPYIPDGIWETTTCPCLSDKEEPCDP
jgi:hypothetical protein